MNRLSPSYGKYVGTPYKTIEEILADAQSRVAKGENPRAVTFDLVEGYCLGWGSANCFAIQAAAIKGGAS